MNSNYLKFFAGILGLAVWAWLAFMKMTPIEPLIDLLKMGLGGLVVHMLQSDNGARGEFITGTLMTAVPAAPPPGAQAGFVSIRMLVVVASIALGLSMLAGCSSMQFAGNTTYEVTPIAMGDNGIVCSLKAVDGKEFEGRTLVFDGGNCQLAVDEKKVKAFKGQALAVKAINILPTMGLGDILAPQDK